MIYQKLILAITFIGLTSCSALMSQNTGKQSQSSSLMEYLYPDKETRKEHPCVVPTSECGDCVCAI